MTAPALKIPYHPDVGICRYVNVFPLTSNLNRRRKLKRHRESEKMITINVKPLVYLKTKPVPIGREKTISQNTLKGRILKYRSNERLVDTQYATLLGLYSLSWQTSDREISWSLEAGRFGFKLFQLLRNLVGTSAVALSRCLSISKAIGWLKHPISRFRDFSRSYGKTSYCLVNRGPEHINAFKHVRNTAGSKTCSSVQMCCLSLQVPVSYTHGTRIYSSLCIQIY